MTADHSTLASDLVAGLYPGTSNVVTFVVAGHLRVVAGACRLRSGKGMEHGQDAFIQRGDLVAGVSGQPRIDRELNQVVGAEAQVFRAQIVYRAQKKSGGG